MPGDIRFDLEYWRQIARKMAASQDMPFAVVKNPLNNEYFPRSLKSAKDFKNDIVWSTDQPEPEPKPEPDPDPHLDFPPGLLITYMITGGGCFA